MTLSSGRFHCKSSHWASLRGTPQQQGSPPNVLMYYHSVKPNFSAPLPPSQHSCRVSLSANTEPLYFVKGLPVSTCRGGGEGKWVKVGGGSPWTLTASLVKKRNKNMRKVFFSFFCFLFFLNFFKHTVAKQASGSGETWETSERENGSDVALPSLKNKLRLLWKVAALFSPLPRKSR